MVRDLYGEIETAVYRTVLTVVWEDGGETRLLPDSTTSIHKKMILTKYSKYVINLP
jgi:hypothetical protein